MVNMTKQFAAISDIVPEKVKRAKSGMTELDWLYGYVRVNDIISWGIPMGRISLWAGEKGVGKSRLSIALAKVLNAKGWKIVYFQTETTLEDFAGWVEGVAKPENFICSGASSVAEQIKVIRQVKPHFVFVDSVNEIDEFENGTKKESRFLMNGDETTAGYRDICKELGNIHVIFLCQLNQDGSIKGGTTLPHLVDINFHLVHGTNNFIVKPVKKHRYGRTGPAFRSEWMHVEDGVVCTSEYSTEDEFYCKAQGIPLKGVAPKGLLSSSSPAPPLAWGPDGQPYLAESMDDPNIGMVPVLEQAAPVDRSWHRFLWGRK